MTFVRADWKRGDWEKREYLKNLQKWRENNQDEEPDG